MGARAEGRVYEDNETADGLTKKSFCGITKSHVKGHFQKWENDKKFSHWAEFPKLNQSKSLSPFKSLWVSPCWPCIKETV